MISGQLNTTIAYDQLEAIYALAQLKAQGASPLELEFMTIEHYGDDSIADAGTHRILFTTDDVRDWLRLIISSSNTEPAGGE